MPPELRKRKAAAEPAAAPPSKKKGPVAKAVAKVKEAVVGSPKGAKANGSASATKAAVVGDVVDLEGFGGEIETHDGTKTTLKKLVDESTSGVILFTYPKASTPGCTNQACLFRDSYTPLTATGFAIYGLSRDSPKANTTFRDKKSLPYPLLCDISATLISAIGLKKAPSGTTRGIFIIDKTGKVLAAEPGSPGGTVAAVQKFIDSGAGPAEPVAAETKTEEVVEPTNGTNGTIAEKEDVEKAEVAAEVADTAEKIDSVAA